MYNKTFLMVNIRCSKHVEDTNNLNKTLILKVAFCCLTLHNCITMHGTKNMKRISVLLARVTLYSTRVAPTHADIRMYV